MSNPSDYQPIPLPPVAGNPDFPVIVGPVAPTNPTKGLAWFNTAPGSKGLQIFNGTVWVAVGGIPPATAPDQLLVSGAAPGFAWAPSTIDDGRF